MLYEKQNDFFANAKRAASVSSGCECALALSRSRTQSREMYILKLFRSLDSFFFAESSPRSVAAHSDTEFGCECGTKYVYWDRWADGDVLLACIAYGFSVSTLEPETSMD